MFDPLKLQAASLNPAELGRGALVFLAFVVTLFLGSMVLPGRSEPGVVLPDGSRKHYRLNGLLLFLVVALVFAAGAWRKAFDPAWIAGHFLTLFIAANVFSFVMTFVLYLAGRGKRVPHDGPPGLLRDCFYGVELNPTWLGVDLKMFSYRPSLMGLGLINASFAFVQLQRHGHLSTAMVLYQLFVFIYLFNYFQFEYGMLHTWDIIAEKFGWMLVWGDYVFVPFIYSVSGWYIIDRTGPLSAFAVVGLGTLYAVGFVLFRGANEQKHQYKTHPEKAIWGRAPEALGGRLLVSGFWGIGRKLNYTGELAMYYAWTLLAGFASPWPWIVPLWLTVFFPHRAWRDEQRCHAKYGALWEAYCKRARFRMIPFLY